MPDDAAEFAACVKLPAMAKNIQSAADALTSTAADISAVCGHGGRRLTAVPLSLPR